MKNKRKYLAPHVLEKVDELITVELNRNHKILDLNEILNMGLDCYIREKGYNLNPPKETLERFNKLKESYNVK